MPIYRRCSRCGARYETGSKCPRCDLSTSSAERYRTYDKYQRDKDAKKFYDSDDWKAARAYALELDGGWDVYAYMTSGKLIPADTVHHVIPRKDNKYKALDPSNLMSVSAASHAAIEHLYNNNKQAAEKILAAMLEKYRAGREGKGH